MQLMQRYAIGFGIAGEITVEANWIIRRDINLGDADLVNGFFRLSRLRCQQEKRAEYKN